MGNKWSKEWQKKHVHIVSAGILHLGDTAPMVVVFDPVGDGARLDFRGRQRHAPRLGHDATGGAGATLRQVQLGKLKTQLHRDRQAHTTGRTDAHRDRQCFRMGTALRLALVLEGRSTASNAPILFQCLYRQVIGIGRPTHDEPYR